MGEGTLDHEHAPTETSGEISAIVDEATTKHELRRMPPPPPSSVPRVAQRFALSTMLGRGGMGTVFLAHDTLLDEMIALKIVDGAIDDRQFARLQREVKLARRVTHANVVRTFDMGLHEETPFITMELVVGESLRALIRREGRLDAARTHQIVSAVCTGLASAHAASVLHLDLKPGNILLGNDGRIAVTDFGIASLADAPAMSIAGGTPGYMAPERIRGATPDARADVYSFGVLLFEMHAGHRPPLTELPRIDPAIMHRELAFVTLRCLAREPDLRYGSAIELLADLERALRSAPVSHRSVAAAAPAVEMVARAPTGAVPAAGRSLRSLRAIEDPHALEHYLLGRVAYAKTGYAALRQAVEHFEEALQRSPDSPTLLSACALALVRLQLNIGEDTSARAGALASRAIALDPTLADALVAKAAIAIHDGREDEALMPLATAVTTAPWLSYGHLLLGELLVSIGATERGLGELTAAASLEPMLERATWARAQTHALLGDFATCDELFGAGPASQGNIEGYWWRRQRTLLYDPSKERMRRLRDDLERQTFAWRFIVDATTRLLETRDVPEVLEGMISMLVSGASGRHGTIMWASLAIDALAFAERWDDALALLERIDPGGLVDVVWLERAPVLERLRATAVYREVRDRALARAAAVREVAKRAGVL